MASQAPSQNGDSLQSNGVSAHSTSVDNTPPVQTQITLAGKIIASMLPVNNEVTFLGRTLLTMYMQLREQIVALA